MNSTKPPTFAESAHELVAALQAAASIGPAVDEAGRCILECLKGGGKIMTCGNGGSAADALHLAEECVGRYQRQRRPLPALCLAADPSVLTCIANDYGYDKIFSRGVEAFGKPGDVLVGFTTSGNSPNILAAFESAKRLGVTTILIGGQDGGKARSICDHAVVVPWQKVSRIQEIHTLILHQLLEAMDAHPWE